MRFFDLGSRFFDDAAVSGRRISRRCSPRKGEALVSKLERRADMYVSSLRTYIEAMGGELEIVARFPDGAVRIGFASYKARSATAEPS